jgi:hypothetical protein
MSEERAIYTTSAFTRQRALSAACQVRVGNSCGSGSIVGHWNGGSLVISNHHVTGGVGRSGTFRFASANVPGRVIVSGYSQRTLADWSISHLPNFTSIAPVPMSKIKPLNQPHFTHGSPRCVFPLVTKQLRPTRIDANSKLILFTPDAIGGQSGSGVWDDATNIMQALIAWSWGGQTGAQQTAEIYRMTTAASVEVAGVRPEGLVPLNVSDDVELVEGFHVLSEATGNIRIQDLPIWYDPNQGPSDPQDPDCPPCEPGPKPEPGSWLSQTIFANYLKAIEEQSAEFRAMLESGGVIPEEDIKQPTNPSDTHGL